MRFWEVASNGGTKEEFLAAVAEADPQDTTAQEVATALACCDRVDLLEVLLDHPLYGEECRKELDSKRWMDQAQAAFEARCETYPPIMKRWRPILKCSARVGIYDVVYPSRSAIDWGLGANYVAITGDGLLDFLMEVVSLDGDGQFRPIRRVEKPEYETETVQAFLAALDANYGDVLTGEQVVEGLKRAYNSTIFANERIAELLAKQGINLTPEQIDQERREAYAIIREEMRSRGHQVPDSDEELYLLLRKIGS